MKPSLLIATLTLSFSSAIIAGNSLKEDLKKSKSAEPKTQDPKKVLQNHAKESSKVANDQDELSADVQDLIQDQTDPKVLKLLRQAEELMAEATDLLEIKKTGGATIAIETEIIEKIIEAAKKKQQKGKGKGKPKPNSMLEMMEEMAGKKPGKKPGGKAGEDPGQGSEGSTDKESNPFEGSANNTKEERTVPKNTSSNSRTLPREEQRALDAYNNKSSKKSAKP